MHPLGDPSTTCGLFECEMHRNARNRRFHALAWKEILAALAKASEVLTQNSKSARRQRHDTVVAVFGSANVNHHALAVDVTCLERENLRHTQTRAVHQHEDGLVFERRSVLDQRTDLASAQHVWLGK